ncbi:MAG: hypothetical protein JM58_10330 [Peptococcaceae bacterium BICA1-8]|nr:MAG: hypothetical protein JM58_10330 [Peptococcaceae bacterium BICA1-8]
MYFLIDFVDIIFDVMYWLVIVRVILSWIRHDPHNPIFRFIYEITEIVLGPVRKFVPMRGMAIDFSPIIAILLLQLLKSVVISLLSRMLY